VEIVFDAKKNERNLRERGLSFERAADFDFETAIIFPEIRQGEARRVAVGYLDKRLHVLCYLPLEKRHSRGQLSQGKSAGGKEIWQTENH
jgi:uncharacterized protein